LSAEALPYTSLEELTAPPRLRIIDGFGALLITGREGKDGKGVVRGKGSKGGERKEEVHPLPYKKKKKTRRL